MTLMELPSASAALAPGPGMGIFMAPGAARHGRRWEAAFDELTSLRGLQDDYDGEGAPAPPSALIDAAARLLRFLHQTGGAAPTAVVGGADGSVAFEWHSEEGFVRAEMPSPAEFTFIVYDRVTKQAQRQSLNLNDMP